MRRLGHCLLVFIVLGASHGSPQLVAEVERLLSTGDQINFQGATELILLLGSTGVGKSTLSKFITRNPTLQTVKVGSSYVFTDDGTISTVTSKSMTLLPNVYKDPETGQVIVDCPGFSDTREPKFEIAASYFVKRVMEYAKKLKIILVENHFSLMEGADRFGFTRLLRHVAELIPNVNHFKGSMSLVATKVINQGIPDQEEKADILTFINNFANQMRNDLNANLQNASYSQNAGAMLKVIDVLLNGGSGANIQLFRRPNSAGSPYDSPILQKSRQDIRDLIFTKTAWVDNANQIYKFTLTTDSIVFIRNNLVPSTKQSTLAEVTKISNAFATSVVNHMSRPGQSIEQKHASGTDIKNKFVSVINGLNTIKELSVLTEKIAQILQIHGVDLKILKGLVSKADFYHDVGGMDINALLNGAKQELQKNANAFAHIELFYSSLLNLRVQLDDYGPQSVRHTIARPVTVATFKNFIYDAPRFHVNVQHKDQMLAMQVTEYMVADLNVVLNAALGYVVNPKLHASHFSVEGRNVFISDVNAKRAAHPGLRTLTVVAGKSVFIDQNIDVTNVDVNIVAPRVVVVRHTEFLLRGSDAGPYPGKAADSHAPGVPGVGGNSGHPGLNGGNFVLVTLDVINPSMLVVKSLGGRGGRGQNGGNGRTGVASGYPAVEVVILGSQGEVDNHIRAMGYGVERNGDNMIVINQKENVLPTAGGGGGVGGPGGHPGHIVTLARNQATVNAVNRAQVAGAQGEGGDGGAGGVGLAQCARKHYACHVYEEHGRCGKWYRRKTCLKHRDYRCHPNNLDNCGNYAKAPWGGKGTSTIAHIPNQPVAGVSYAALWQSMNERVGLYQNVASEYSQMIQYAHGAVPKN